jgi:hypothetical protein
MARGWESKSVESQMDAAEREKPGDPAAAVASAELESRRARAGLVLTRTYLLRQIEAASNERYKESLRSALADIDQKIQKLDNDHS